MPQSILLLLLLFSISFFLPKSLAQDEVGVDKCACSPGAYEFTLNFTATCDDSNVPNSDNTGILETTCITQATDGGPTLSEVFVEINFFGVIEIEPSNASLAISRRREMFSDMQAVTYTSATSTISDLTADELLRKITVIVFGTNVVGQEIQNVWSVTFTNECGGVPVFDGGQPTPQIGVTKLVSFSEGTRLLQTPQKKLTTHLASTPFAYFRQV